MVGVPEEREGNNGSEEWRGGGGKKNAVRATGPKRPCLSLQKRGT